MSKEMYSSTLPVLLKTLMIIIRYRTMVRSVRLGYNVLMTDNDVVMFDDPYHYFKSPPFSHFTVLNQMEFWATHENNGGFIYIQNARSNGPAVWLYTEVRTNCVLAFRSPPFLSLRTSLFHTFMNQICHRSRIVCSAMPTRAGSG